MVRLTQAQRRAEVVVIRVTHCLRKCNHERYCLVRQPAGEGLGNMKTEEEAWVMEKSNVILEVYICLRLVTTAVHNSR